MSWFRKKELLSKEDQEKIVQSIQQTEKRTSGEVRVFVENHCRYVDAIERACELFFQLKMEQTKLHNGVIVYVALKDRQSAILGDSGIYKITGGPGYWKQVLKNMNINFREGRFSEGIVGAVQQIGDALSNHFPYNSDDDKNELPDDIVFGR